VLRELARRQARAAGDAPVSGGSRNWPPRQPCFLPRLGDYLARLEQEPLASLLARPAALARALRRAGDLLSLTVECLDVPAAWLLHSAGWPATVGEHGIALGSAPAEPRAPAETVKSGPLAAVCEALRSLPPSQREPVTLLALPSPASLARAAGGELGDWPRAALQALLRTVGELGALAGILFDDDEGVTSLGRLLEHYQLTPVCVRGPEDARPAPAGAAVARALPLPALAGGAPAAGLVRERLVTTLGAVAAEVAPQDLLRASQAMVFRQPACS
jgi:hypothetical protein